MMIPALKELTNGNGRRPHYIGIQMKQKERTKIIYDDFWKDTLLSMVFVQKYFSAARFNPLTAVVAYIRVFFFYWHIKYHLLKMLKIKCDINQQYLKTVDLHFVKSE